MAKKKWTKLQAIKELVKYDHCFLTPEAVREFSEPFGFKGSSYLATDTRSQHKGLNLGDNFKEGDKAEGQDADNLACEIARKLNLRYSSMFGRGSRLRECCRVVIKHLQK